MKQLHLSVRVTHLLCILLFVLPFFRQCASLKPATPTAVAETAPPDSVANVVADTVAAELPPYTTTDVPYAYELAKELHRFRWLLMHGERDYTGFGMAINGLPLLSYAGTFFVLLLLLILIFVRWFDKTAWKTLLLLDTVIVVLFFFSQPWFSYESLWGYWVVFWLTVAMLIQDVATQVWPWWQRRKSVVNGGSDSRH